MKSSIRRVLVLALWCILALNLVGCKPDVEGKYTGAGGLITLELKGGKAMMGGFNGVSETCDYTVDGDKITLKSKAAGDIQLTRMSDGSLQGNGMTLTKSAS